jgi:hypothetical protein
MQAVRTLSQELTQWRVYEVSTKSVPGAAAASCLIFDSEAIVRRCWAYPADWFSLPDNALWAVLLSQNERRRFPRGLSEPALPHPVIAATAEAIAASQALASELQALRSASRELRQRRAELLTSCHESRDALLSAVGKYTSALKLSGATPELALVLVKEAIRDGLGGDAKCEESEGSALMDDGIAHAIRIYYAA